MVLFLYCSSKLNENQFCYKNCSLLNIALLSRMKFILLVIFAFQFANFGQTQVTIPLYCDCLREWFEDRAEYFCTEKPNKLAKKIFNSWNTIVDDQCIEGQEYKNNVGWSSLNAVGSSQIFFHYPKFRKLLLS